MSLNSPNIPLSLTKTYKDVFSRMDTPALVFSAAPDHWDGLTADSDNKTFPVSKRPAED